jgi:hypothetical protein
MVRRTLLFVSALALFAPLTVGCGTPSPEKVCAHVKRLAEKEDEKWSDKENDRCVEKLGELQKENKEGYECLAKCVVDGSTFKAATRGCDEKCEDKLEKKKDKDKKKSDD